MMLPEKKGDAKGQVLKELLEWLMESDAKGLKEKYRPDPTHEITDAPELVKEEGDEPSEDDLNLLAADLEINPVEGKKKEDEEEE